MIARRFLSWVRHVVTACVTRIRNVFSGEHAPQMVPAGQAGARSERSQSDLTASGGSWIDDGRRLRSQVNPLDAHRRDVSQSSGAPRATSASEPVRQRSLSGSQQGLTGLPEVSAALRPDVPTDVPPPIAGDSHTEHVDVTNLEELEQLDAGQRRLVLLRYLVRQRVYNEGFPGDRIPQQYHHSVGLDESSPADDGSPA